MKKLMALFIIEFLFGFDANKYNAMFEKLKETRITLSKAQKDSIKDPFAQNKNLFGSSIETTEEKNARQILILQAIFDDKAKISSKWYAKNDIIEGYKIVEINENRITLQNRNEKIFLKIIKENGNVEIK